VDLEFQAFFVGPLTASPIVSFHLYRPCILTRNWSFCGLCLVPLSFELFLAIRGLGHLCL
jgi:hypothetical protein